MVDRSNSGAWHLAAVLTLGMAVGFVFLELWRADPRHVIPYTSVSRSGEALEGSVRRLQQQDALFVTWLVSRNAHALLHHPWRLFHAEHCAPHARTLTLSEPALSMGLLAVPAWTATRDPILTYNLTVAALLGVAAAAMYLLVAGWTGVPAAGIVAGLLYTLAAERTRNLSHPFIEDTAWTVLLLWFAQRLFSGGRWRDALGLVASGVLQLGAGFYPTLGAALLLAPYSFWLVAHYGLRRVPAPALVGVAAGGCAGLALVYGPYLGAVETGGLGDVRWQDFATWPSYGPGGANFPGWIVLALVVSGLLLGRRRALARLDGDPRWALGAGAAFVAILAASPRLYGLLASVLPGMDVVRAPERIVSAAQLALCVLAGSGAAAWLQIAPARARLPLAVAGIALTAFATLRTASPFGLLEARPSPASIAFFDELEELGNAGPILELPLYLQPALRRAHTAPRILLSAWHHRRTSACMGSQMPSDRRQFVELARALPAAAALAEVANMGFTTLLVHRDAPGAPELESALRASARRRGSRLAPLHSNAWLAAWRIDASPPAPRDGPRAPRGPAE